MRCGAIQKYAGKVKRATPSEAVTHINSTSADGVLPRPSALAPKLAGYKGERIRRKRG